jgi:hypothetical protein
MRKSASALAILNISHPLLFPSPACSINKSAVLCGEICGELLLVDVYRAGASTSTRGDCLVRCAALGSEVAVVTVDAFGGARNADRPKT